MRHEAEGRRLLHPSGPERANKGNVLFQAIVLSKLFQFCKVRDVLFQARVVSDEEGRGA